MILWENIDVDSGMSGKDPASRHILELCERKKWVNLCIYLETPEGEDELNKLSSEKLMLGWNVLHSLCAQGAPFPVVRKVAQSHPSLASDLDVLDRTPLHISVDCSASADVVDYLVHLCPEAALVKDDRGRTPLIRACEMIGEGRFKDSDMLEHSYSLIEVLVWASPLSVLEEDDDGASAIELALCNDAPDEIVRALQREACHEARNLHMKRKRDQFKRKRSISRLSLRRASSIVPLGGSPRLLVCEARQ